MNDFDLEICYLSASEALERFKNKSLSPVELLSATIKRIESINPKINAFNFFRFEEALEEAKKSEFKYIEINYKQIEEAERTEINFFNKYLGSRIKKKTELKQ